MGDLMDRRLAEWFGSRDTGLSSKCIALFLAAGVVEEANVPHDPSDLGRCLRLLARIPEWKSRISELKSIGGLWPTYAARWDEMAESMADEVGIDWSKGREAPKTYDLMKRVEVEAYRAAGYIVETSADGHLSYARMPTHG